MCTLSDFVQDLFPVQKWQGHQEASSGSFQLGSWEEERSQKGTNPFPGACLGTPRERGHGQPPCERLAAACGGGSSGQRNGSRGGGERWGP